MADAEPFVVEVLDGPESGLRIELGERSLPYRSGAGGAITFSGAQRVKTTWYPGGGPASQQVSGETLDPTTIDGAWRDHLLGAPGAALALAQAFEAVRQRASRVRVSWGRIIRVGVLSRFEWRPGAQSGGVDDIAWTATFDWASASASVAAPLGPVSSVPAPESSAGAAESLSDLATVVGRYVMRVEGLVGAANTAFAASAAAIESAVEGLEAPVRAFARAAKAGPRGNPAADLLVAPSASEARARVGLTLDALDALTPAATLDADDAVAIVLDGDALARCEEAAFAALAALYDEERRAAEASRPLAVRVVRVVRGETWRALAARYFGAADLWWRLAAYNGADGSSVVPEDMVEVAIPESLPAEATA